MKSTPSYEYLDRNVEAVQEKPDTAPVNKTRELRDIENGMINDTISLIEILDGSQRESPRLLHQSRESEGSFNAALYLDKSGRPLRQLTHALWESLSNSPEPHSLFLNIDKRPWLNAMGIRDTDGSNLEDISPEKLSLDAIDPELLHNELTHIRALYLTPKDFEQLDEDNLDEVWNLPTQLDGKTVAIIDEVKSSGNTLRIALELLKRAIPDGNFEAMWWSTPQIITWEGGEENSSKTQKAAKVAPVWYDRHRESGRGIGDIDVNHSTKSPSKAQRIGRAILSAPERDEQGNHASSRSLSAVIRRDIGRLVANFKSRDLVRYTPDRDLDDKEFDRRIEMYYKRPAKHVYDEWRSQQGR